MTIRGTLPGDEFDYARLLSMQMTAPYDVAALADRRKRYAKKEWHEQVAEVDGKLVGIAELVSTGAKDSAMCRIVVDQDYRNQRIGASLLEFVAKIPLFQRSKVFAQVRDDEPFSLDFAEKAGFVQQAHVFESFIDPSQFDIGPFLPLIEQIRASELKIVTLADLGSTEETRYKLWEIEHVTDHDIPGLDPDVLPSWEDAKDSWYQAPWFDPHAEFLALDGDRFVGASGLAEMATGVWSILHTCTLREYRGRGIATALKALATNYAKEKGSRLLKTNNHSENEAMLAINRRFGFQPMPGWIEVVRNPK